jgi:hypothetical protein
MADKKQDFIDQKSQDLDDAVDRRVLKCMAWGRCRASLDHERRHPRISGVR